MTDTEREAWERSREREERARRDREDELCDEALAVPVLAVVLGAPEAD